MPIGHFFKHTRKWAVSSLYSLVIIVFLAFALMVASSYFFVSDIEFKHLRKDIENAISNTENSIKSDLLEPEALFGVVSETIRDIILSKKGIEDVHDYIKFINKYVQSDNNKSMADVIGFYGVFDVYGGRFLAGSDDWTPPDNYGDPSSRPWYKNAEIANGDLGITELYIDLNSNEISITFSSRIFDDDGYPLGIIGLDIKLDRIRQYAVNTRFAENGYGFLLSENMEIIAHPEPSMIGMRLGEVKSNIAFYDKELERKGFVYDVITSDYRGIESIVSIQKLQNDWYMGIVTPKDEYYQSTKNLARILSVLGILLAVILSAILIKIISEKRKSDERTIKLAHWYEAILDTIPLPISVTDSDMNWTFINKAVEDFLEVSRNDVLGKHCSNWRAHICNTSNCGIACARRGIKNTYFIQKDSSFKVDVEILTEQNGETTGYIEVVQDITKLEQMAKRQVEVEVASRAKSDFLAKTSHEIRTPMNAILGITEIQLQNETLPYDVQEALNKIYNSGYLLLGIINDILDLSKIEAGKLEISPIVYDTASLINDTIHLNIMWLESKPIAFTIRLDENIPSTLLGDDLRIKQILNNLLSNAFKYTESGEISLSIAAEPAPNEKTEQVMLVFCVKDTGQGMTRGQIDKLFDEYIRFNTEVNRSTMGTGLGMTITKSLVQMMNGEISVESEPDKGSLFTVRIPQNKIDNGVLGKELAESLQNFSADKILYVKKTPQIVRDYMPYGKVLIVDDVETNLYVGMGLLAPYGLLIETALSGLEAVNKIKNGGIYDIIFMDHYMPKMDGIEAVKIIRELGYAQPIIALTANALAGQAEMFIANGFDGFISKPIDIRQLNAVLNKLVRDKHPNEIVTAARASAKLQKNQTDDSVNHRILIPEIAKIFTRDAGKTVRTLETMLEEQNIYGEEDIKTYIINVHSMKSALANIGEGELSKFAGKLEQAGREKNTVLIMEETPAFLNKLETVINKIKQTDNVLDGEDDTPYLHEKLSAIQTACAAYDKKTVKNILAEIGQKTWSQPTKEKLDALSEHLLHSEFEKVSEIAGIMRVKSSER